MEKSRKTREEIQKIYLRRFEKYKLYIKENKKYPKYFELAKIWGVCTGTVYKTILALKKQNKIIHLYSEHEYTPRQAYTDMRQTHYNVMKRLYQQIGDTPRIQDIANALGRTKQAVSQMKMFLEPYGFDMSFMDEPERIRTILYIPKNVIEYAKEKANDIGTDHQKILQGILINHIKKLTEKV